MEVSILSFLCRVSNYVYGVTVGLLPVVFPSLKSCLWVIVSGIVSNVLVGSCGLGSLICFFCGGSSWNVICECGEVSASFHDVRTGERCEHVYATYEGADCKACWGFTREFVICSILVFLFVACPVKDFNFFLHRVLGWPFRLAASRVLGTRCRESALGGADPGLSLVASGRCFCQKRWCERCFSMCGILVKCVLIFSL